jgi:hypothetical protein
MTAYAPATWRVLRETQGSPSSVNGGMRSNLWAFPAGPGSESLAQSLSEPSGSAAHFPSLPSEWIRSALREGVDQNTASASETPVEETDMDAGIIKGAIDNLVKVLWLCATIIGALIGIIYYGMRGDISAIQSSVEKTADELGNLNTKVAQGIAELSGKIDLANAHLEYIRKK